MGWCEWVLRDGEGHEAGEPIWTTAIPGPSRCFGCVCPVFGGDRLVCENGRTGHGAGYLVAMGQDPTGLDTALSRRTLWLFQGILAGVLTHFIRSRGALG